MLTTDKSNKLLVCIALAAATVALCVRVAPIVEGGDRLQRQCVSEDGYLMVTIARNLELGVGFSVSNGTIETNGVQPVVARVYHAIADDGILMIKDVDTTPAYTRWFTPALDRIMVGMDPIRHWPSTEMIAMVERIKFRVYTHEMRDVLPYPHRLYVCRKG